MGGAQRWMVLATALWLAPSCTASVFQCSEADDCAGPAGGTCEATGYCSFPDEVCPSGRRYGEFAQGSLSGACVPLDDQGSSSTRGGDSGSTASSLPATLSDSGSTNPGGTSTGADTSSTTGVGLSDTGAGSSTTGGSTFGDSGSSSTTTAPQILHVDPTIAVCTDPVSNDAEACEESTLSQAMRIDTSNGDLGGVATTAFVSFDFDDALASSVVITAELQLTVTDQPGAASGSQSGELWLTESFDHSTLSVAQPSVLGDSPIAPDHGAAAAGETIVWDINPADIDMSEPLFLALVPTTSQGVEYWNAAGIEPPRLRLVILP